MAYADLATIQTIATGEVFTAATLQQARDNEEFLIDPPACSVSASTAQSVNNNTLTALTADTETFDNDSMHSTATNTDRITIQTAGRYLLAATIQFAADTDGDRNFDFQVNGTTAYGMMRVDAVTTGNTTVLSGLRPIVFEEADYVKCRVIHLAGAALNVQLLDFSAYFMTR